ncbi:hydroxymethylpyrimidine/phosphomethylpyrimidine kinase [Segetibacter koreensis]|uniref:hydroxymethylpyrimidine/phosphomethylpyrimidine kinase n=1 Tax=Segetibacter koreensis TaxID=398037 RepID=UPI00037ED0D0|nr:hydroxymethylpyrimidine/phosphomethylpyrimidine kinase [Segetibacter koreensis]
MEANRQIVLSIAGLDPSSGAGLLADIKTFEQHKVYGLGVSSAQTLQNENEFFAIRWEQEKDILQSIDTMLSFYDVKAVKIGIVENIGVLQKIVSLLHQKNKSIKIVWDTVIRSTSGFCFWNKEADYDQLCQTLSMLHLITPNYLEAVQLVPFAFDAKEAAKELSPYCNVLLKGGHNEEEKGVDYLYTKKSFNKLKGSSNKMYTKHGSGCVLSAAITANLASGTELIASCQKAKQYIEQFLSSNKSQLGYHYV